jgi:hypothetical protein
MVHLTGYNFRKCFTIAELESNIHCIYNKITPTFPLFYSIFGTVITKGLQAQYEEDFNCR